MIGTKRRGARRSSFFAMSSRLPYLRKLVDKKRVAVRKKGPIQKLERMIPPTKMCSHLSASG
jgi:hypothetical protein